MPSSGRGSPLSLLDPHPFCRVNEPELQSSLAFAFATGEVGDDFERLVDRMELSPSAWDKAEFARDVFLPELVDRCLPVVAGGKVYPTGKMLLLRLLSQPPKDRAVVDFRHAIFRELVDAPHLRAATERLYALIVEARSLLARTGIGLRLDANRRRLDVLRTVGEIIDTAAADFPGASSGLKRIGVWGRTMRGSLGYVRLRSLLAYEKNTCELDLRVHIGFDGRIRDFFVLKSTEPVGNPFHTSHFRRWMTKAKLMLSGYRFAEEELLSRLVDEVFAGVEEGLWPLFPLVGDLEVYLAGLAFRDGAIRAGLPVSLPELTSSDEGRALDGLFNPLLLSEGNTVVPCDLRTSRADSLVIVTGPNSGGKTRLLQSLALTQIMAQSGMYVPAERARIPWAEGLFVSLIEHANVDQKEGRLGTELVRIRRLFEHLREGSLVIVDELCSGTNPQEGEDIFRLVVKLLGELRPATFVTTHFLAFAKRLASESPELEFLQVELDREENPTYQFVPGVATSSLAHRTAARLGVTEDALRKIVESRRSAAVGEGAPSGVVRPHARERQHSVVDDHFVEDALVVARAS
jgi:DNA mismatch repair protein MutS2